MGTLITVVILSLAQLFQGPENLFSEFRGFRPRLGLLILVNALLLAIPALFLGYE